MGVSRSFVLAVSLAAVAVIGGCAMEAAEPSRVVGDAEAPARDAGPAAPDAGAMGTGAGAEDAGSGADAHAGTTADGGTTTVAPIETIAGEHGIEGTWDVSAPIGGDRTLGVVASELFVEEAVGAAGVPSSLEGSTEDALALAIGDRLADLVDARVPAELAPGSPLMAELGMLAARVRYESTLSLSVDGDAFEGTETFHRVYVENEGRAFDFPLESVAEAGASFETTWAGVARERTLDVDPHLIELRYGLFVVWLADSVLGVDVAAITDRATSGLACGPIVDALLDGRASIDVGVSLLTIRIERATLLAACAEAFSRLETYALGLFSLDTPLEIGGTVDVDFTVSSEAALRSGADHGGHVLVGPRALSPPVRATFSGSQVSGSTP